VKELGGAIGCCWWTEKSNEKVGVRGELGGKAWLVASGQGGRRTKRVVVKGKGRGGLRLGCIAKSWLV
jgi:hypothetical protein